jgi:hypothetical protein
VAVDVYRHLDGAVPHLVLDVGERGSALDEQTTEGVTQIVKPNPSQAGVLERGQEIAVVKVIRVEDATLRRWEVMLAALSKGAEGYILKADAGRELMPAVKAVLCREKVVSR